MRGSLPATDRSRALGRRNGLLLLILICGVWGWVLPRLAQLPWADAHRRRLSAAEIDASAMFYTEIDPLQQLLLPVQAHRSQHPQAWWQPLWPTPHTGQTPLLRRERIP